MFNNIVKIEKLYNFLLLYRRSLHENFDEEKELLSLSKEISRIGDEEYNNSPKIIREIIDIVRLYEFNQLLNNTHEPIDAFEKFWMLRITEKVAEISNPINDKQAELICIAKERINGKKN